MIAISTLVLSLALTALAAPSKRQDNGACQALQSTCASSVKSDLSDAWNIKACVFGATCFGGQRPVDGFLAAVYAQKGGKGAAPTSAKLARVTSSLFNSISSDHKTLSKQNFIDGFYSSLDASGGPYPTSSSIVESYYQRVAVWTAYCSSAVPLQNFADYLQYSATVSSDGCAGSVTSATIVGPSTTVVTSALTAVASQTTRPSQLTSTLIASTASTTTVAAPPSTTTTPVTVDASCAKMTATCSARTDQAVSNPWSVEACVLAAICHESPWDLFVSVYTAKNPYTGNYPQRIPDLLDLPRLSASVFAKMSADGKTLTQQNFIDAYYGTLASVGGPYPASTDVVVGHFNSLLAWTAFCPGTAVPSMNVGDYLMYFTLAVGGGHAQC